MTDAEMLEKVKEYVQQIRKEASQLRQEEWDLKHEIAKKQKEFEARWSDIKQRCPHLTTVYHPDPSGNNDSGYTCSDCDKWI